MAVAVSSEPSALLQQLCKEIMESEGDDANKAALLVSEANAYCLHLDEWRTLIFHLPSSIRSKVRRAPAGEYAHQAAAGMPPCASTQQFVLLDWHWPWRWHWHWHWHWHWQPCRYGLTLAEWGSISNGSSGITAAATLLTWQPTAATRHACDDKPAVALQCSAVHRQQLVQQKQQQQQQQQQQKSHQPSFSVDPCVRRVAVSQGMLLWSPRRTPPTPYVPGCCTRLCPYPPSTTCDHSCRLPLQSGSP
jgi:hypothetical protein